MPLVKGLYEALITEALALQLQDVGDTVVAEREQIDAAEAPDRIALHLSRVVRRAIAELEPESRTRVGIDLARRLVRQVLNDPNPIHELPTEAGEFLRAILDRLPDGSPQRVKKSTIKERAAAPSAMPPGLGDVLGKRALRDLVEYLATLK